MVNVFRGKWPEHVDWCILVHVYWSDPDTADDDDIEQEPEKILQPQVYPQLSGAELRAPENIFLHVGICVDELDVLRDVGHSDGVHPRPEEEVVVVAGDDLLVKQDLEQDPDEDQDPIEPDGVKPDKGECFAQNT